MSSWSYVSSEDSALLRESLREYSGGVCLEIGAGNGGGLILLSERFGLTVGTDIRPPSFFEGTGRFEFVVADSASCFRQESFDLVAFNPPYLPSEGLLDRAVDGGEGGEAVSLRFLEDAMRVVKRNGKIVMLLSTENPVAPVERLCEEGGFEMKLVGERHLFYESLSVYEVAPRGGGRAELVGGAGVC